VAPKTRKKQPAKKKKVAVKPVKLPVSAWFGPAGYPIEFKGRLPDVAAFLAQEGLNAFEYQAVRGVRVRQEEAELLRREAKRLGIRVSIHAPYYINLAATEPEKLERTFGHLLSSLRAAQWMGAYVVVFHPASVGKHPTREDAFRATLRNLKEVAERADSEGLLKTAKLGPELTGKKGQIGSLEEIVELCLKVEGCVPVIDWAHLHARRGGWLRGKKRVLQVLEYIEKELGREIATNLHCHFSYIEYTDKGERRHHTIADGERLGYGPRYDHVASALIEFGAHPVIISESPILDKDAIVMRDRYIKLAKRRKR